MRWLESQEQDAAPLDEGEVQIHEMLDMMHRDRKEVKKQIGRLSASPVVPEWIQQTFADEGFVRMCHEKFDALDLDRNGVLTPLEVFPVIEELSQQHPMAITYDHCIRFVDMF